MELSTKHGGQARTAGGVQVARHWFGIVFRRFRPLEAVFRPPAFALIPVFLLADFLGHPSPLPPPPPPPPRPLLLSSTQYYTII